VILEMARHHIGHFVDSVFSRMEPILVCGRLPLLDLFEIAEHESHPFAFLIQLQCWRRRPFRRTPAGRQGLLNVYVPARIESAEPTKQCLTLPILGRPGNRRRRPDGYDVTETARAVERQRALPAEPIHRCKHLGPRIGRHPLNQLIETAGHQAGHFVANDGVKAGDIRLYHSDLLCGGEGSCERSSLFISRNF